MPRKNSKYAIRNQHICLKKPANTPPPFFIFYFLFLIEKYGKKTKQSFLE